MEVPPGGDDRARIQAVVDAGQPVKILDASYYLNGSILFDHDPVLEGMGPASILNLMGGCNCDVISNKGGKSL